MSEVSPGALPLTRIVASPRFPIGRVDPRLFGSFVEHMHRCVYTGIYEPGHATADGAGFRGDVADLVREIGVPMVRYPGGNFVSGYDWENGIGPRDARGRVLDLAWGAVETNEVGTDEFVQWCRAVNTEPMLAVNLGTRGVEAAARLVEYCNGTGSSELADLRRRNGSSAPHDVRVWCLGNEMDGPWQIGHKTAEEYGRLAAETARAMRRVDPRVELVACGSSNSTTPTLGSWERTVLEQCYEDVDYLSVHCYYEQAHGDRGSFLASAVDMDRFIEASCATADAVKAMQRHTKTLGLSFDEWNVWFAHREEPLEPSVEGSGAPEEDTYSVMDAVVVGSLLISLLRHADRVRIACQAQLVNVLAPIRTVPGGVAWRQTIFHPYALTTRHARAGTVLRTVVDGPSYGTDVYGVVPVVDAVAVWHDAEGELVLFAVNRDEQRPAPLAIELHCVVGVRSVTGAVVADDDPSAMNSETAPDRIRPRLLESVDAKLAVDGNTVSVTVPALSWTLLRVGVAAR